METLQPKLRFPEFEGTWEFKSLREITSLITKGTTPKTFSENGVNFIKIECLNGHNIDTSKCLFIDEKTHNKELKRSILQENDLLFAIAGATIGKCTTVKKEALPANTNQALAIIRLKEKENKDYIFQILTSECMSKYIKDNISVGAQPNLNLEQINSFSFSYPSHEEQTRIANFLSLVDEKLNLLKEKKSLLEEYKKGIMQKIFNQEIRFKDDNGNDFEEWEEKSLGECLNFEQPTKYLVDSTDYNDSFKTPVLTAGKTFILGYTDEENGIFKQEELPVIIFDDFTTATQFVNFPFKAKSSAMKILKAKENICIKFIYESMQNLKFEVGGHGRHWISIYSNLFIDLPTLKEQTKIANFFSAIDEKIALVSNQIQDTQEYKKGLLQQMFV
jgi:type I restriction enzyme S subunit